MKPRFPLLLLALAAFLVSCETTGTKVQVDSPPVTVEEAVTYDGPRARIAVKSFECKAAKCAGEIGSGVSDMVSTALFKSNRFVVLEREGLKDIQEELALSGSGMVEAGKGPAAGLMEGADILVKGAITAFEPDAGGMGASLGGMGGGGGGFLGSLLGGLTAKSKEAYIAADIRLIDVRRGRIISAAKVEGKASSFAMGVAAASRVGGIPLGGGLGGYKNTPMEQAVRDMLDKAVAEISKMVPESYYRYSPEGEPLGPAKPAKPARSAKPRKVLKAAPAPEAAPAEPAAPAGAPAAPAVD